MITLFKKRNSVVNHYNYFIIILVPVKKFSTECLPNITSIIEELRSRRKRLEGHPLLPRQAAIAMATQSSLHLQEKIKFMVVQLSNTCVNVAYIVRI